MIKKLINIVIWLLLIAWVIIMMSFINDRHEKQLCKQILVSISDSADVRFVTSESVREKVVNAGFDIQGYPIENIPIRELESLLEEDQYIINAEVYTNIEGDLLIDIEQRKPLLRVMPGGKKGFYIDYEGKVLQLSENFTPMILPLSGYLEIPLKEDKNGIWVDVQDKESYVARIQEFAKYVSADPFWSKQIVQLYRGPKGDFEIIPRVGAHQIIIGNLEGYREKLRNLKLLYDQGLNENGWNTYNKINLKYSDQIICTKR